MTNVWERLARGLSPVEDRPRVADGLESAAYQTRRGTAYVVLHNPAARTYARLEPREFELLELMDGTKSVKELVIAYYQRNGALALARVAGLVRLLREQRFLADGSSLNVYVRLGEALCGKGSGAPNPELKMTSVDSLFAAAYARWGHFFFHRAWLVAGLVLGIIGPALVVIEIGRGRYAIYDGGGAGVLLILVVAVVALVIHEMGHGLAVKHAGRRVAEAGVRLYYGLPAAFVDTTDVWMAPPAQRILAAFAGPWTGLVLGGLAAIVAEVVSAPLAFTVAFVFVVDNLFNFNPLLELDGYYMLVDVLDRPLLRARSLAFVRGPLWSKLSVRQRLTGEERLLAAFGLGSVIYTVLAVVLAARAWQTLLVPLVTTNLSSGNLPRQLAGLLILLAVAVPLALGGLALLRRLIVQLRKWLAWASGVAAVYRHRDVLGTLQAVPVWSEVPQVRLLEIARAMRAQDVAAGVDVVRQGEVGDRFYLIAEGAFEVLVDGQPRVRLGRGDFFGERALLQRVPRAATVTATETGRVFVLERRDFETLLASDLEVRGRIEAALTYRDEVAAMPLFRDISPGELDALLARLETLFVVPGERIIRQGEPGDRFYVLRSGRVEVERDGQILAELGPGEAFGEIALLLDVPRTATVTALQPTTLLALEAGDFRDVLAAYLGRAGELERMSHLRLVTHN